VEKCPTGTVISTFQVPFQHYVNFILVRLGEMCKQYMDSVEEFNIYRNWLTLGRDQVALQKYLCKNHEKSENGANLVGHIHLLKLNK